MINNKEDEMATPKLLTQSEVQAIRERAAKATPGPCMANCRDERDGPTI